MESMEVNILRGKSAQKDSQFRQSEKLALRKLKTEQVLQVLRAAFAFYMYAMKDHWIQELFFFTPFAKGTFLSLRKAVQGYRS